MSVEKMLAPIGPDSPALSRIQPNLRQIYDYWCERRGANRMPRRADIDPLDLPKHLPGIILVDVEGVDADGIGIYRYRVVGTEEVANRDRDPTGLLVSDGYLAESLEQALLCYESVRRQAAPVFEPLSFESERGYWVDEQSIALPLSEDGSRVSQILVYSERRRQTAAEGRKVVWSSAAPGAG